MAGNSDDTFEAVTAIFAEMFDALPPKMTAKIISPSARRRRDLDRRNKLIVSAIDDYAHLASGFARALSQDLKQFRSSGYRADAKFDFSKQAKLRAILDLNKGKALGEKSIANIWKAAGRSGKK